ncbi:hypothetical protein A4U61_01475 [Streptomyces sp. H-KF8]|uniref:hypothetical protein n=1 Tax=Streptomyces sp. H-KF8 TaxID=1727216 RepID=UPI0007ED0106|nr:hypothetical protein [Streptomyces sp. H-KF8]OBQ52940.1 hypothetical protein A4U61_01475 [Streptomyces sp. H-KF8]
MGEFTFPALPAASLPACPPDRHEDSRHCPGDDFVTAVSDRTPPSVNARVAVRRTPSGVIARRPAPQDGTGPGVPGFGGPPR